MRYMFKVLFVFLSVALLSQNLFGDEATELKQHFRAELDGVLKIIDDKKISHDKRNEKIVEVLSDIFDFELMAKLSLGKKAWNKLSDDEKKEFTNLYVERMKKSYSSKLDAYEGQKIEIKNVSIKKNRAKIATEIEDKHESLEVVYKLYKPKEHNPEKYTWLIYDVEIKGVSILKADRAQFKEFLKTKTIYQLMDDLKKQSVKK